MHRVQLFHPPFHSPPLQYHEGPPAVVCGLPESNRLEGIFLLAADAEGGAKTLSPETRLRDRLQVYSAIASRPDTRFFHKQDQRSRSMRIQPALGHLDELVVGNLEAVAI